MKININGVRFSLTAIMKTVLFGDVGFGNAYVAGDITLANDEPLYEAILRLEEGRKKDNRLLPYKRQKNNASDIHYNLPAEFYQRLLGSTMSYTGGRGKSEYLRDLQDAKHYWHFDHLGLDMGDFKLLECGAGWGAFIDYLVQREIHVGSYTGICKSIAQVEYSNHNIKYCDWRDYHIDNEACKYDRFVSMGMIEHVGLDNLPDYIKWVRSCLKDNGVGTLQFICRDTPISSWADKEIFNGAEPPPAQYVANLLTQNGMRVCEHEIVQDDYVRTLKGWIKKLDSNRKWVIRKYGVAFYKTFELYLHGGVASFTTGDSKLVRLQFKVVS